MVLVVLLRIILLYTTVIYKMYYVKKEAVYSNNNNNNCNSSSSKTMVPVWCRNPGGAGPRSDSSSSAVAVLGCRQQGCRQPGPIGGSGMWIRSPSSSPSSSSRSSRTTNRTMRTRRVGGGAGGSGTCAADAQRSRETRATRRRVVVVVHAMVDGGARDGPDGPDGGGGGILFSDFVGKEKRRDAGDVEGKVDDLIDRASKVLKEASSALDEVRKRDPVKPGGGGGVVNSGGGGGVVNSGGGGGGKKEKQGRTPSFLVVGHTPGGRGETEDLGVVGRSSVGGGGGGAPSSPFSAATAAAAAGGGGADVSRSPPGGGPRPEGVDGWFAGKVDAGPLLAKSALDGQKMKDGAVLFKEKEKGPAFLDFLPPEAPAESKGNSIFPASLALRFQSQHDDIGSNDSIQSISIQEGMLESDTKGQQRLYESEEMQESAAAAAQGKFDDDMRSEQTQGEEFGSNGYWYRWTEINGKNASGTITWTERWWEISDWSGMKELGAEKYGSNAMGDAWRETWTESISVDADSKQPIVSRSAHKWARSGKSQEWEEKWAEKYWSGGKAEKWADKWGRDGRDVWHEKWGEKYDGHGGCVKWTDRWAEGPNDDGVVVKWGDKWEETFKDGKGNKTGETWSEDPSDGKYQRWWGENHFGDGSVQKFGNSTTGESWDVTEHMDTYYNPIPHFGYDLALSHSPQLRNVPSLPRDDVLEF